MAIANRILREKGAADRSASRFIIDALFATITNANFDNAMLDGFIDKGLEMKNELIGTAKKRGIDLPYMPEVSYHIAKENYGRLEVVEAGGSLGEEIFSVLHDKNEDIRGLKQLAVYGCKGMAAYARHALNLGYEQEDIYAVIEDALADISRPSARQGQHLDIRQS